MTTLIFLLCLSVPDQPLSYSSVSAERHTKSLSQHSSTVVNARTSHDDKVINRGRPEIGLTPLGLPSLCLLHLPTWSTSYFTTYPIWSTLSLPYNIIYGFMDVRLWLHDNLFCYAYMASV